MTYVSLSPGDGKQINILNHINLTVPDGKLVVITGPNGSGKSTLARVIMGLEQATSGTITFNGQQVQDLGVTERPGWASATAFSSPPRFKGMKVSDLLECAAGKRSHPGGLLPLSGPGGPVQPGVCGPGCGRQPLRRRAQAH